MSEASSGRPAWEAPRWLRTSLLALLGLGIMGLLFFALRPQPVPVDLAPVDRGPVEVVVEEDGRTRVRDRHVVIAPVSGTLRRIEWQSGDAIEAGQVVAQIDGPRPDVLDPRTEAQIEARLQAARARVERARAQAEAAEAAVVEAREEVRRQEVLQETSGGSRSALERARALLRAREAEHRSARFAVEAAAGEVEDLRLALEAPDEARGGSVALRAPVDGAVLRVHRESEGAVAAGTELVEIGDPRRLEVVVDLLSADAVRVWEGASAELTRWGGNGNLPATVRRVEPSGFTSVSALGIEEQRVNTILDPVGSSPEWSRMGDGFRVEARILVDRAEDAVRLPAGALFRSDGGWAVFRVDGSRLREVRVEVGRRSSAHAEVLAGLSEDDRVVVYPGDQVEDGVRFTERD